MRINSHPGVKTALCSKKAFTFFFAFLLLGIFTQAGAQAIRISRTNGVLANSELVAFPTAAKGPSFIDFTIQNTGAAALNLSGAPAVQVLGTNAAEFVVTQPSVTTLAAGATTTFRVTYTPTGSAAGIAQLRINNNDATANPFTINLKGGGNLLYGAKLPPVDGGTIQLSATANESGRAGGRTITLGLVSLADKTTAYWGPSIDSSDGLQLKLSLDGNTYTGTEIFTYSPSESSRAAGRAVWRGQTKIQNAITGALVTVYTRATLTTTRPVTNAVVPMIDPVSLGLSEQVGGLVQLTSSSDYVNANFFVEASLSSASGFQPYLDFYDAYPTPVGPLPGAGVGAAYVSLGHGLYWNNLMPRLNNNQIFDLNEGATKAITTAYLNATDDEDVNWLSKPDQVVFNFMSVTSTSSPLNFNHGTLMRNGVPLVKTDSFTLKDIQDGIISYQHDGSENFYDEFQFSVKDSKKTLAVNSGFTVYTFKIQVNPVNDPPVTRDTAYTTSYVLPLNGTLTATDPDNTSLTFSVVSGPASGSLVLNADGTFTYTPGGAPGSAVTFSYRASDGTVFSNTSTVTINLVNMPPLTQRAVYRTLEDVPVSGTLLATDPEGTAVTFQLGTAPSKGTVTVNTNGSFTYQPSLSLFGTDRFTFRAADAIGNLSAPDTITIHIIPRLDEGNILVADQAQIHLYDPSMNLDTVISANGNLVEAQNVYYKKGTSVFAVDKAKGLIRVDPYLGTNSVMVPASAFNPNPGPLGIVLNPAAGYLVIADGPNGIRRVDTTSNAVSTLFSGGSLQFPAGVVYLSNGDLLVADAGVFMGGTSKILRITPAGVQTVVSTGNHITLPVDLALIDQNTIVVSDGGSMLGGADKIYKIDLATGVQTLISSGGSMAFPSGLDYYIKMGKLYVVNQMNARLLDVNPSTGTQATLSGSPSFLTKPFGMMVIQSPVYVTSVNVPADSVYMTGETLSFTVNYSENVVVNTAGGVPYINVVIGGTTVQAAYVSGSGSSSLVFNYTVKAGELDKDGVGLTTLGLNGGTIRASGVDADNTLVNISNTTNVWVDGVPPVVNSVTRFNPTDSVTNGNSVVFRVRLSENVSGVTTSSFVLTAAGASGTIASVAAVSGNVFDVTVNNITGPGTLRLDVPATGSGISDLPGNPLTAAFVAGELYYINNAPVFSKGATTNLDVCINAQNVDLGSLLGITDIDNGQTLSWKVLAAPVNGTVGGFPSSGASNGAAVVPSGTLFSLNAGFNGTDAFSIEVSDGISRDTILVNVQVTKPLPGFSVNADNQCVNANSYVFTNSSTVNTGSLTYTWNFGDGGTATSQDPAHVYTAAGNYPVKLVVRSVNGCTDSTIRQVTVAPRPAPGFTINSAGQCINGNNFQFTNTSSISAGTLNYQWTFGDGGGSTQSDPSHGYLADGIYPVKLVAISANGCKDSVSQGVTIYPRPVPGFTANTVAQCVNTNSFQFANTSAISSGTFSSQWYFGDGAQSVATSPVHVYTTAGSYTVKLVVTSGNGCKDSLTQTVTVYPKPAPGFTINSSGQCVNGNNFQFTNNSTVSSGSMTWLWKFADGATSTQQNPAHTYAAAGSYSVKLIATSNNGCSDSVANVMTVYPKPTPSFVVDNSKPCINNNSFGFTSTSVVSSGLMTYNWSFGDQATATGLASTHSYSAVGSYPVKLVATSDKGCADSIQSPVDVYGSPLAGFAVNTLAACLQDNNFQFTNTSAAFNTPLTYSWNFGDGTTSSQANPGRTYSRAGTYEVRMVSISTWGCVSDTAREMLVVHPHPKVDAGPDRTVLEGRSITLNPVVAGDELKYQWTPATSLTSSDTVLNVQVAPVNDITYVLHVTGNGGCSTDDAVLVKVLKTPVIPNAFSPNGDGINDTWKIKYLDNYPGCSVEIYTRSGQLIYRSNGYGTPWDGRYNGASLPLGTYYYIIDPKNGREKVAGSLTILR